MGGLEAVDAIEGAGEDENPVAGGAAVCTVLPVPVTLCPKLTLYCVDEDPAGCAWHC